MSVKGQVILITFWFVAFVALLASTIWDRMAEWSHKAGMSTAFRWLYPAKLREKEVWVRFQKGMTWCGLFFGALVYALALASILSRR